MTTITYERSSPLAAEAKQFQAILFGLSEIIERANERYASPGDCEPLRDVAPLVRIAAGEAGAVVDFEEEWHRETAQIEVKDR